MIETTVTDEDIRDLAEESARSGDTAMYDLCAEALMGHESSRAECVRVITEARIREASEC